MQTREELEAELATLNSRLSEGLERISRGDRSAQYNLAETRRRRDEISAQLGRLNPPSTIRRVYVVGC